MIVWTRARASSSSLLSAPFCLAFWTEAVVWAARLLTRSLVFLKNAPTSDLAASYSSARAPASWRNSLNWLIAVLAAGVGFGGVALSLFGRGIPLRKAGKKEEGGPGRVARGGPKTRAAKF